MGEKFWIQDFETGLDRLRVWFVTERGEIRRIIVIQYEAYIDGKWRAIVRYDEAHGFFHRDIMLPGGAQDKSVQPDEDRKLALTRAIEDMKQNWRAYRQRFEGEYYE